MDCTRPHVYIVEDDSDVAHFYREVAQSAGWRVTSCGNGTDLLRALARDDGSAMLLIDIHLPDMDGIDVIDFLKEKRARLRIRFMTGGDPSHVMAADMIAKARSMNVGRSLYKPVSTASLSSVLHDERAQLSGLTA